jgi:starch synthase
MEKTRVLFVSQEIFPFVPESEAGLTSGKLAKNIQEKGKEIRVFMPRYGKINERRHQLHEVIRLSGMNMVVNGADYPLIIKVASVPQARMQVYFIDNDEFFKRKHYMRDENEVYFKDTDERAIFFAKGVLETVKKLGWVPDVIHCHGWMSAILPAYARTVYKEDPHFADAKIV